MGQIILVGNEKGGTGKTTIAVNLAAMAAVQGKDVLLIDADPGQQSAAKWAARRQETHPEAATVRCVSASKQSLGLLDKMAIDLAARYEVVVIDTGAEESPQLRAAAMVANLLIVPVQPEQFDFWTLPTMETIYERAKQRNDGLRCKIVLNRIPYQIGGQAVKTAQEWMAENVPALPNDVVPLIGRAAYGNASADGLSVHEAQKRDAKAASELQRLYREAFDHGR